ncbi:hypothetical protein J2S90_001749 [Arthrobacter bambusae]|uniref:Uncharacterized protein n=1 Tax=Arthrobacter bambusae TaxID=1338426 RepID=A0AAW8DHP5_9MICC|nr:hypothetical protein [Arthrobacter bambusae]MDQ0129610.1 hypothetical protein [Arthrobacter bambusae]MDQ0180777.1 hypothetical protein [Arthrobacter bambusae]
MGRRIYDAEFETSGTDHEHLGRFWWTDSITGQSGTWSRAEAVSYVGSRPKGDVFVSENGYTVAVGVWYYTSNPNIKWIQTESDGQRFDNLTTLAQRRAAGLVNK